MSLALWRCACHAQPLLLKLGRKEYHAKLRIHRFSGVAFRTPHPFKWMAFGGFEIIQWRHLATRYSLTSEDGIGKVTGSSDAMAMGSGNRDGGEKYGCGDPTSQSVQQYRSRNVCHGRGVGVGQSSKANGHGTGITACRGRESMQGHHWCDIF